jgi:hypothetical protein
MSAILDYSSAVRTISAGQGQVFSEYNFSAMEILALAVLLTIAQASPSIPRQTADNSAQAAAKIKDDKQSDKTPTHDSVTADKTIANGPSQGNGGQQNNNDAVHTLGISKLPTVSVEPDWGMYIFSFLLVAVGALQVWLLYRTWGQIERQAGIMERQTLLMERQINEKRAHIRVELEEFAPVYPQSGEDSAIQEIKYKVTFYGFAYAFIDEQGFEVELRDSPDVNMEEQLGSGSWLDELPKVVSPDMKAAIKSLEPMLMTQFEIDSLFHGKSFLHFKGRIRYHDFSDIPRETTVWQLWKTLGPKKKVGR